MRTRRLAALAALALVGAVPTSDSVAAGPTATAACTRATIEGQSKCIARGQFCKRSAQAMRDYRRYGLSCTNRDANGRYHLR
jgi:hypothetical protein